MSRRQDEDLLAQLDALSNESPDTPSTATTKHPSTKAATSHTNDDDDDDGALALEAIQAQLATKRAAAAAAASSAQPAFSTHASRPTTPRLSSSTTSGGTNKSPRRAEHTPASSGPPSGRNSEERARGVAARSSGDGGRSYHQSFVPGEEPVPAQPKAEQQQQEKSGGGWWGSMFSAATAAVSQAQNLAKEIRENEDALKWAEQVRGYGAGLQNLSTDIRSRALPTFSTLLSHIAPPIAAHERLQIHTTHDILHYPSLDPLIYSTFSRIMSQVEGGDLLVIQRGSENRSRSGSSEGYRGGVLGGNSGGWADGPWWRDEGQKRDLGVVRGLKEGSRLARVSAESYAKEFFDARGGVEEAARRALEGESQSNPVRSSDIFLAIQAVGYTTEADLFAGDAHTAGAKKAESSGVVEPEAEAEDLVCFAIYLHDPLHSLSFSSLSQPFPQKWAGWLDAAASVTSEDGLPESIVEMIEAGGVDPREWVAEWMEEVLALAVGVVAQRYVARRMGVGEGGLGKGKRRVEENEVAGEAARAL